MKKSSIIYAGLLLLSFCTLSFTSCKSSKAEDSATSDADSATEEVEVQEMVDPYTGWHYVAEKKLSIKNGNVKIEMNGEDGTFCLYAVNESGKSIPVLATRDAKSASFFSLLIDKTEYPLLNSYRVKTEARRTPYGAQMAYTVAGTMQVVVDFSFAPSIISSDFVDMLRVTVYTINIGIETHELSIKALFDTVLGESSGVHFSTAAEEKINVSRQYETMARDKWVTSSDGSTSIQFLLCGNGISIPRYVTLANKDLLSASWVPAIVYGQGFHTVYSNNNSALGINYSSFSLSALKSDIKTFFIALATDKAEPKGQIFLASLETGETSLPIYNTNENDEQTAIVPSLPESDRGFVQSESVDPDFLYAQMLVERVKTLDEEADAEELHRLNKELDEVLLKLQKK